MNREFTIAIAIVTGIMGYRFFQKRKKQPKAPLRLRPLPIISPHTPPPDIPIPVPVLPPAPTQTPSVYRAPIIAEITAEVGAPMHNVISTSFVKNEALKRVERVRQLVENCPNAPKLQGAPQIVVRKTGGGLFSKAIYFSTITWSATWQDGFLYDNTADCIKKSVMGMFPEGEQYIKSINISKGT